MNILRRYIYTHETARVANYSSNCRSTHSWRDWISSATPRRKKRGRGEGIKEFGTPENVQVQDARATEMESERTKEGKREGERENERYR